MSMYLQQRTRAAQAATRASNEQRHDDYNGCLRAWLVADKYLRRDEARRMVNALVEVAA